MIKTGIIGVGHLGKIHISLLKQLEDFEICGFYDTDLHVRKHAEDHFHIKAFSDVKELIDACDALIISCPTPFHYTYAEQIIKSGKHLFIEKPVTETAEEVKALMQLGAEARVVVQAGYVERFNPAFLTALPLIKRPLFITCERLAAYNPRGTDVSAVLDLMVHDIDLVLKLVKSPVRKVRATGAAVICPGHDVAQARLDFDNGAIANFIVSRIALGNKRSMQIFQPDNFLWIDLLAKTITLAELKKEAEALEYDKVIASHSGKIITRKNIEVESNNAIKEEFILFARAIQKKEVTAVTLEDAYNTLQTAQQIIEAIAFNE